MSDVIPMAEKVAKRSHTPGPWHWDSDPVKNDPFNRIRYQVCATGKTITQVYYSSFEGGLTNAEADARLIAAAPDMLWKLRELAAECAECAGTGKEVRYMNGIQHEVSCRECDDIRKVIAKAEGRS